VPPDALAHSAATLFLPFMLFGYAFETVILSAPYLQEEITYKRYNAGKTLPADCPNAFSSMSPTGNCT